MMTTETLLSDLSNRLGLLEAHFGMRHARVVPRPTSGFRFGLRESVKMAVRGDALTTAQVARAVGASLPQATAALEQLAREGEIADVGTARRARWLRVIGDETSPAELAGTMEVLCRVRSMTFADLLRFTGARRGRVSGVIVQWQRSGRGIVKAGAPHRATWRLVD